MKDTIRTTDSESYDSIGGHKLSLDQDTRLASLVPKPRVNLTRFHGVFAPNSAHRARVTPGGRGKGNKAKASDEGQDRTPAEHRASMRLKRSA